MESINNNRILITGIAGFIGFHVAKAFTDKYKCEKIVGIDSLNTYYDPTLKAARLKELGIDIENLPSEITIRSCLNKQLFFKKMDLCDFEGLRALFKREKFDLVIHLAAQAGVRYSIINPQAYVDSNVTGFLNILNCIREFPPKRFIYASSSSIYGLHENKPFSETDQTDNPVSIYASTKKMNEMMAKNYAQLYGITTTGLRFFTVYGEWGRPDMALFRFTEKILRGENIELYNYGDSGRDFTYIGDVVRGIIELTLLIPNSNSLHEIYNIGRGMPVLLKDLIKELEKTLAMPAKIELLPLQPGDVPFTFADVSKLYATTGFMPQTCITEGISRFIKWYKLYYGETGSNYG